MTLLEALRRQIEHYGQLYGQATERLVAELHIITLELYRDNELPDRAEGIIDELYLNCRDLAMEVYRVRRLIDIELANIQMTPEYVRQLKKSPLIWKGRVQPDDLPDGVPDDLLDEDGGDSCQA